MSGGVDSKSLRGEDDVVLTVQITRSGIEGESNDVVWVAVASERLREDGVEVSSEDGLIDELTDDV